MKSKKWTRATKRFAWLHVFPVQKWRSKKRTHLSQREERLTLEELKYVPETYELALSVACAPHAQLSDWQAWRRCKVWLEEDLFSLQHAASGENENIKLEEFAVLALCFDLVRVTKQV